MTRVRTEDPLALALWIGVVPPGSKKVIWTQVDVRKVNPGPETLVRLRAALPTHAGACPLVRVVPFSGKGSKANGAFLTPPVRCGG